VRDPRPLNRLQQIAASSTGPLSRPTITTLRRPNEFAPRFSDGKFAHAFQKLDRKSRRERSALRKTGLGQRRPVLSTLATALSARAAGPHPAPETKPSPGPVRINVGHHQLVPGVEPVPNSRRKKSFVLSSDVHAPRGTDTRPSTLRRVQTAKSAASLLKCARCDKPNPRRQRTDAADETNVPRVQVDLPVTSD